MDLRVALITISDRSFEGTREDSSGPLLKQHIEQRGWAVINYQIIPDEFEIIISKLLEISRSGQVDLILTTGGTGFSPRDVTPEATLAVLQKRASGLSEFIRLETGKNNSKAFLSRAEAGILDKVLIINLPGNPNGAAESFDVVAPLLSHSIALINDVKDNHSLV